MVAHYRIGLLAGFLAFAITAYLALVVFHDYPFSADEYNYWYQAQIFALGKLSLPIDGRLVPLGEIYTMVHGGRIFSRYSPGFSTVLTPAIWLGVSGLVNPLISALTIMVVFATLRRLVSAPSAIAVTFLMAFNSYFLGYGGSYFSQPLTLLLTACGFYSFQRYEAQLRRRDIIRCGAAVAFGFLVRPLDAFCLWLAIMSGAMLIAYRRKEGKGDIEVFCAVAFAGMALLFVYNYWTADCFCVAKYPVWDWQFKITDPKAKTTWESISNVASTYYWSMIEFTWVNFTDHFITILGLPLLLLALLGASTRKGNLTLVCGVFIFFLVALYTFHPRNGWPQYGSRYWYPAWAPLAILAAYGAQWLQSRVSLRWLILMFALAMLWQGCRFFSDIKVYTARFAAAQSLRDDVDRQCPVPSIVVIDIDKIRKPVRLPAFVKIWDLKRNPFLRGDHLFVYSYPDGERVQSYFRNYALCPYIPFAKAPALIKNDPPHGPAAPQKRN